MNEKTVALVLNFNELMDIYFSANCSLLKVRALEAALPLADSWEQFDVHLDRVFPDTIGEEIFLRAALKLANTHQACRRISHWGKKSSVAYEAAEKMATFAHTVEEWREVELYAMEGSELEILAAKRLSELGVHLISP